MAVVHLIGRSLTTTQLTMWPLLINCGWFRSSWSRAERKKVRTWQASTQKLIIVYNLTSTMEVVYIYYLLSTVLFLFWEQRNIILDRSDQPCIAYFLMKCVYWICICEEKRQIHLSSVWFSPSQLLWDSYFSYWFKKKLKYSLRILIPFEEMRPEIPTFKMVGKQKNSRSVWNTAWHN